jgi:hypothetical protein
MSPKSWKTAFPPAFLLTVTVLVVLPSATFGTDKITPANSGAFAFRQRTDEPVYILEGMVVNSLTGEPIRGAQVIIFRDGVLAGKHSTRYVSETMTDDEGNYRFPHLLHGTYILAVSRIPGTHAISIS